jgi:hypothetical protein
MARRLFLVLFLVAFRGAASAPPQVPPPPSPPPPPPAPPSSPHLAATTASAFADALAQAAEAAGDVAGGSSRDSHLWCRLKPRRDLDVKVIGVAVCTGEMAPCSLCREAETLVYALTTKAEVGFLLDEAKEVRPCPPLGRSCTNGTRAHIGGVSARSGP